MWDSYIRGEGKKFKYKQIQDIYSEINNGRAKYYPRYKKDGNGYFKFLKDMKKLFLEHKKLKIDETVITWPKAIDEFNYMTISTRFKKRDK
jgi:hypothetical protein